uniref:DNA polymerase kappa n=1 Tax=Haemonchus contortus TaxID=6289 RepID=A0A7I4YAC1_HAECO
MLTFNDNKAGMAGLDKERISKIIESNTSGNYSNFSKKQQDRINEKTESIKKRLQAVSPAEWSRAEKEMDELAARLECHRDLRRDCVHIDMDAYFAAVEMRDDPSLRTVPMAVGSLSMLSTSNYLARRFGVRAAMPGFIAKKLCPQLKLVHGNFSKYKKENHVFRAIFAEYDEDLSMGSLDEAYLDITEYVKARTEPNVLVRRRYGGECICKLPLMTEQDLSPSTTESCKKCGKDRKVFEDNIEFGVGRAEVVREIRFRVEQATGLTCSAGIAPNFRLAKICSDMNKPNGQYELANNYEKVMEFLSTLPIRKVCGIGRVSEALLQACGICTVGQLLERRAALKFCFSELSQECFLRVALGLPGRPSSSDPRRKSISTERTFTPTSSREALIEIMEDVCDMLVEDMKRAGVVGGRCVTLKLKLSSFDVLTRSETPGRLVSSREEILAITRETLDRELPNEFRLLGIRLSNLQFEDERASGEPISVLDFWKRQQHADSNCIGDEEASSSSSASDPPCSSEERVSCPICGCLLRNDDRVVNQHVDECLNASMLLQEDSATKPEPKVPKKRKATIENFLVKKDRK